MTPPDEQDHSRESSRAPRAGLRLMIVIVIGMALLAVYANVQKARRDKIEKITVIPITASPSATPSPKE